MDKINLESSTDFGSTFERYPIHWPPFTDSQWIGITGTSTVFGDKYESSLTVTEIDENYLNYKRIADLQKQFTKEFINLLKDEDFEYGIKSKADILVRERMQINALATKSWLNHIFIEYFKDITILLGILRVVARLEYYQIYPEGQTMALAALSHDNEEVQECGVRAYENWEVLESLKVLENIKANSGWLQDYISSVVGGLRKKLMPELARKFNAAKWRQVNLETTTDVSADAITSSLKTKDNALSFWEIESEEYLDQAALALAAAAQQLETFDVVRVSKTELHHTGLEINKSEGKTEIKDLKDLHFDIVELTYTKLGVIANHIVSSFKENKVKRYTKDHLRSLLNKAIQDGRLRKEDLPDPIKSKL